MRTGLHGRRYYGINRAYEWSESNRPKQVVYEVGEMAKFYSALPVVIKDVPVFFRKVLARLPDDFHVCLEFQVRKDYDIVVLHQRGVHILEVKHEKDAVTGGPTFSTWTLTRRNGVVEDRKNFFKQAKDAADLLRDHLRRESGETQLLSGSCARPPCRPNQFCETHRYFWSHCRFLPYVAIPEWNPANHIETDSWCWLVQGDQDRQTPEYVIDALCHRGWDSYRETKGLKLSELDIERIIANLPVDPITQEEAFGEPPRWFPGIDSRVDRSLREQELAGLRTHLNREHLVVIVGEPKVGKTSLAKLFASDLDAEGVEILDYDFRLHDRRHGSLSAVMLEAFLERLRLPVQRLFQDSVSVLLGALTTRRLCLILDNFESVLDKQLQITDQGLSALMDSLLFSKSRLESYVVVTATSEFWTENKNTFPRFSLHGVDHEMGVAYLTKTYSWTSAEAEQIYGLRQGNPHAFHLASHELRQSIALGLRFDEAFARLSPEVAELTYGVLYSKFSPAEKRLVELVALHPNGWHFTALEWIAPRLGITDNVFAALTRLHQKGALTTPSPGWMRLLPQDQPYVYSRIDARDRLHLAAIDWHKGRLAKRAPSDYPANIETYEQIFYHAVRAKDAPEAWHALFTCPLARALERSEKIQTLLYLCRQLRECEGFEKLSPGERARLSFYQGLTVRQLGNLDEAVSALSTADRLFSDAGDVVGQAEALAELGLVNRKQGKYGRSELDYYDLALDVLGEHKSAEAQTVRCRVLGRKGQALQREGADPKEVFQFLEASVAIARQLDDKILLVVRLGMLGAAHRELGQRNFPAAIACFQEALKISEDLQSDPAIVGASRGLAMTYEKSKNLSRALELYQIAFEKTNKADVYGMIDRLGTLGHVHKSLQKYGESENYYCQALKLAREVGNRKAEAENLDELGNLYRTLASQQPAGEGKAEMLRTATEFNSTALEIQESFEGDPAGLANRHQELGRTLLASGKFPEAKRHFVEAVRYARAAKRQHLEAWQFRRLGDMYRKLGRHDDALLCYRQAYELDPREMRHLAGAVSDEVHKKTSEERRSIELRLKSLNSEVEKLLHEVI